MGLTFVCGIISLFLPYLLKLNICCGDLSLPNMYEGYHYSLTYLILLLMLASLFSLVFAKRQIITVLFSVLMLPLTWLVRYSIHFQGFIDHDYDSKTGLGFLLLFIAVLTHFAISLTALFYKLGNGKIMRLTANN